MPRLLFSLVFQTEHGQIVKLHGFAGKGFHILPDSLQDSFRVKVRDMVQCLFHPLHPVKLSVRVVCFRNAVGIDKDGISRHHPDLIILVSGSRQRAEHQAVLILEHTEPAVLTPEYGILVSGVGAGQKSGIQIQNAQPHRDEHLGLVVFADLGIYRVQDFTRASALLRPIVDEDFGRHHEQRRGNALIRDIRDQKSQMAVVDQEEVIEISAHFFGRRHAGIEVEVLSFGEGRENMRQHGFLDLGRRTKLCADTLFLGGYPGQMVCVVHNAALHGLDLMVQVADFIIGSQVQLDHVVFCVRSVLIGEVRGGPCQLPQRADRGPPQQDDTGKNSNHQQESDKHKALSKKHIPLIHDFRHVEIHPGDADGFPGLRVDHRFDHGEQPAELRVVDGWGNCRVILIV